VEDHDASVEVACFPATYQLYSDALVPDAVVSVTGKVRKQETNDGSVSVSFNAQEVQTLDVSTVQTGGQIPVVIAVREETVTQALAAELRRILEAHPGNSPVHLRVTKAGGRRAMMVDLVKFSVEPSNAFNADVKSLLGQSAILV
jgi:DNA polymerase-3 subunit alpha